MTFSLLVVFIFKKFVSFIQYIEAEIVVHVFSEIQGLVLFSMKFEKNLFN